MCGINGIFAYEQSGPPVSREELLRVRDSMAARGPDGSGIWISQNQRMGLAHRRLAIIDLSQAGAQPMCLPEMGLHITFNGEIYNYEQLRQELAAKGYRFRSASDTEVLLYLYADRGAEMVHALRGMFAFAIWDDRKNSLFLARDPFGIKPLYYSHNGATFRFASQVKALLAGDGVDRVPEPAGHVGYFVLGSVPEPFTMFRDIRALAAGSMMLVGANGSLRITKFFDIAQEFVSANERFPRIPAGERGAILAAALSDSVRHHLVSDVPVGLFLSAGLDASTVAAHACALRDVPLHSITLGFPEYQGTANDETPLAELTARHLGTVHQTRWITRKVFRSEFDKLLAAMDQPSIDGVNTYFVSKAASECGMKVALSGIGGDELFAGYPSFSDLPRIVRLVGSRPWLSKFGKVARRLSAPFLGSLISPKYAGLLEYGKNYSGAYLLRRALYMPWELPDFMDPQVFREGWEQLDILKAMESGISGLRNTRQIVSTLEHRWYMRNQLLRDADWAGMAHSLEIRVPLVDVTLFRQVAPLLASNDPPRKLDAAQSAPKKPPAAIIARRKTGFMIPVHNWAAEEAQVATEPQRHLRDWSHIVYRPYKSMKVLAFLSDAFGGHGGIALYNRDLLTSLSSMPECLSVVAVPRIITMPVKEVPTKVTYLTEAANSKLKYVWTVAKILVGIERFDLVLCCHINLLTLAVMAKKRMGAPAILFIYGIDAWRPLSKWKNALLGHIDRVVSISEVTSSKFRRWSGFNEGKITILPNAIHSEWYGPGPKSPELVARYGLDGKLVLLTLGRLVPSERYKGFDEVLDAMPYLAREIPDLVYVIAGDGADRGRLEEKAKALGVADRVRFTGRVLESEKADHYRLADAYAMPSRGEGFGFVLLEAMACGIPAVASQADGGREAVRDGRLGILVNPDSTEDIVRGIRDALRRGIGAPPEGLDFFDFENFNARTHSLVRSALRPASLNQTMA